MKLRMFLGNLCKKKKKKNTRTEGRGVGEREEIR